MLRCASVALLAVCGFAGAVSAATIGLERRQAHSFDLTLNVDDPSVQAAIIDAAPADWHLTRGADVWWASIDGANVHVMVFPTLGHPGKGTPQCCLTFVQGDTEFWLKVRGGPAAASPVNTPGGNATSPDDAGAGNAGGLPDGGAGSPTFPEPTSGSGPINPGEPGGSANADGAELAPAANPGSEGGNGSGPSQGVAQIPEPSLLVLFGLGSVMAARRARKRP